MEIRNAKMSMKYKGKKLLLIAPLFFGYYKEIIKEAEIMGMNADYICDAPSNSNMSKAIGRINKKLINGAAKRYFKQKVYPIIKNTKYDYIVLIAGMTFAFTPEMIKKIKERQAGARFIIYQWDSEQNIQYVTKIHKYFDRIYSFDRFDSERNPIYIFLPLFYTRLYEKIADETAYGRTEYNCLYIGTAHPQKFKAINDMAEAVKEEMPSQFLYHYMPSKLKYYYHKFTAPEYKNASLKDFEFKKIKKDEMVRLFQQSDCILDAPQSGQSGLTIRTLECLGAKKKLITTNKDVVNYDFYNESNILVFDGEINTATPFFWNDFKEIPDNIYRKYSLRCWMDTLLS